MPGDLLDLILIVLVIAFAVAGYRQGFIIGVLSFAGFLGGGAIGAVFGPRISRAITSSTVLAGVDRHPRGVPGAVIGMVIASGLGVAVRSRVTWRPATVVDSLGGAVVNVLSVLLVAWLIGSFVAYAPFPAISRQVNNSAVLRTVDRLMPAAASVMFPTSAACWRAARTPRSSARSARRARCAVRAAGPRGAQLRRAGRGRAQHRQDRRRGAELLGADRGLGLRHLARTTC